MTIQFVGLRNYLPYKLLINVSWLAGCYQNTHFLGGVLVFSYCVACVALMYILMSSEYMNAQRKS